MIGHIRRPAVVIALAAVWAIQSNCGGGTAGGTPAPSGNPGTTWTKLNSSANGLPDYPIRAVLVDAGNPSLLYVGAYAAGVYYSTNSGQSWQQNANGLDNPHGRYITGLIEDGDYLFAATNSGAYYIHKQQLTNGGAWTKIGGSYEAFVTALSSTRVNGQILLFIGSLGNSARIDIFQLTPNSFSLVSVDTQVVVNRTLEVHALVPMFSSGSRVLFAGTAGGIYRYEYNSQTIPGGWEQRAAKRSLLAVFSIVPRASSNPEGNLLVGTASGPFELTWDSTNNNGWNEARIGSISSSVEILKASPVSSSNVLIAESSGQLFRYDGTDWTPLSGISGSDIYSLTLLAPDSVFIGEFGVYRANPVGL